MRTVISGLFLTVAAALLAVPAAAQDAGRFAFIDSNRIIEEAPGAREARQALEQDFARFSEELERMEQDLQQMVGDYQQQQGMMAAEARRQREQQIRQKQMELQQRAQQLDEQMSARQTELLEPIMGRINRVIDEIRRDGGYAFIFDAAAGAIVAADPRLDVTDQVLSRLNSVAGQR